MSSDDSPIPPASHPAPPPAPGGPRSAEGVLPPEASDRWRLNGLGVLVVTFAMLIAVGASRTLRHYFSYYELISGYSEISALAVLLRFAIPFFVCAAAVFWSAVGEREATTAALLTSLLLVWPTILIPEEALEPGLYNRRFLLYLVYALFGAAFTIIGRSGARLSLLVQRHHATRRFLRVEREKLRDSLRDLIVGIIGAAIYSLLQTVFTASE